MSTPSQLLDASLDAPDVDLDELTRLSALVGEPIVASYLPGIREGYVTVGGVDADDLRPDEQEALARLILRLLNDHGKLLALGCGAPDCTRCGKPCPTCGGSCEVSVDTKAAPTRARLYSTMRKALNTELGRDSVKDVTPQLLVAAIEAVAAEYDFDGDHRKRSEMCERFLREHSARLITVLAVAANSGVTSEALGRYDETGRALDALMKEYGISGT